MKPRLLDLFCGAGGSAMGLFQAGFDIVGIDNKDQPHYPFRFILGDATLLSTALEAYDAFWASPPCQRYTWSTRKNRTKFPDLIGLMRKKLRTTGKPYVIENVVGAPLINPIRLCGEMFSLKVIRHRLFECNFPVPQPEHKKHRGLVKDGFYVTVSGHGGQGKASLKSWQEAMQINWMTKAELAEAIPPAYSQYIGKFFIKACQK